MSDRAEDSVRAAAERAAAEVTDAVYAAALEAARAAVQDVLAEAYKRLGITGDLELEDRVTRTEAARELGTTSQTIIRLEKKGAVSTERDPDGRVYVRLSEVRDALASGRRVMARARISRQAK